MQAGFEEILANYIELSNDHILMRSLVCMQQRRIAIVIIYSM